MYIVDRSLQFFRGFLLSYGPSNLKKRFWDKECSEEKWSFAYDTVGDCAMAISKSMSRTEISSTSVADQAIRRQNWRRSIRLISE